MEKATDLYSAWCVRDFGFDYEDVEVLIMGLLIFNREGESNITWEINPAYKHAKLHVIPAHAYPQFALEPGKPIYTQFVEDPDRFLFVSIQLKEKEWEAFLK